VTQAELLRSIAETLDALGVEYMIGGSHASIYYGEARLTRDVDIVASLHESQLAGLLARFPADEFYVDEAAARDAIRTGGQFNVIHPSSGFKIDVHVNPDTPYDRARLARRQRLPLASGATAWFARPEDVILYKLLYYREGGSGVHLRDILGMLRVSGSEIDHRYVRDWADRLGLSSEWTDVLRQSKP
jgi:hypothetical protein